MKRLITDDYPCNAVKYWLRCNGGGDEVRVYVKSQSTIFVNKYGDILTFNHVLDFNDGRMYSEWYGKVFSKDSLCGMEK